MKKYSFKYIYNFGLTLWVYQLCILIFNKFHIMEALKNKLIIRKNKLIIKILSNSFSKEINFYSNYSSLDKNISNKLWIFWWQGIEKAPKIVKKCISSIKKYNKDKDIIIITKDNIDEYYQIPNYMKVKIENGTITITHLSDILRMNLLKIYGGFWVDATIYLTNTIINEKNFEKFFSIKFKCTELTSISKGKWTGFFIGGNNPEFYEFMCELLDSYWQKYDKMIDYFLIDYLICICYENNKIIRKRFDNIPYNNPRIHSLQKILYDKYDSKKVEEIFKINNVHKLSYKMLAKSGVNRVYDKL